MGDRRLTFLLEVGVPQKAIEKATTKAVLTKWRLRQHGCAIRHAPVKRRRGVERKHEAKELEENAETNPARRLSNRPTVSAAKNDPDENDDGDCGSAFRTNVVNISGGRISARRSRGSSPPCRHHGPVGDFSNSCELNLPCYLDLDAAGVRVVK